MVIGIDASRAYIRDKTGTENYSYHLINALLRLPEVKSHTFVLFTRPNPVLPEGLVGFTNVMVKEIKLKYLWTQVGLAWETWQKPSLDVLWVPAHTLPILRNPRLKTIVTIHGLEYKWLREYKNLLQRWYLPLSTYYAAKSADKLIAVSKFTAQQLKKELHTSSEKIKVIWEGVGSMRPLHHYTKEKMLSILSKFGIEDKKYILFVGTVQPRKNLVTLIEAFSLFSADNPDYKLVIAGGIGWMAEAVLLAPGRYGVQENVIFTGRVSDSELESLYRGAGLYVQPSITEGFGLPVLEAMSYGVPVVSSDGGALSEVVGEAGVVVKLGENFSHNLATAIKRVIRSKDQQKDLVSMGYKRVNYFTWEKMAKTTLEVITG